MKKLLEDAALTTWVDKTSHESEKVGKSKSKIGPIKGESVTNGRQVLLTNKVV